MPAVHRPRSIRAAVAIVAAAIIGLTLAACSTTVSGSASHRGPINPEAQTANLSKDLSSKISTGMGSIVSAHVLQSTEVSGVAVKAEGDETFANGVVTGFRIASTVFNTRVVLLLANGQGYAQLPNVSTADKPWVKVNEDSRNPAVRSLYPQLQAIRDGTSQQGLAGFAGAATKIVTEPSTTVEGIRVTPYRLTISVAKLPASASKTSLQKAGLTTTDATLYLDAAYRVVKVEQTGSYSGAKYSTTVTLTAFDRAVNIAAPPASQVAPD